MKEFVLKAPFEFEVREKEIPEINEDQVLLKIDAMGVCGSDMQMYQGVRKYMTYPVVMGHEVAATVAKVGKNVKDYKVGDNVTVQPQITCGKCYPCEIGRFNVCEDLRCLGVQMDGFCCEYFAIEASYLRPCPGLTMDETALVEPVAVGLGAITRAGDVNGKNVVVLGAGTIGNLVAQCAKAKGANVMITDIKQQKLDYAKKCGIPYCCNTTDKTLKEYVDEIFGYRKADVMIDTAANKFSWEAMMEAARRHSVIVITGCYKTPVEVFFPLIQRQEIDVRGQQMYVKEEYYEAIEFMKEKKICIDGFVTQHYPSSRIDEAFKFANDNPDKVVKMLITMD